MVNRVGRTRAAGGSRPQQRGGFAYQRRDPSETRARAEQKGGRFDSAYKDNYDTFRAKVGTNYVRILPPTWVGAKHYGADVWVHAYVGPDEGTYTCPRKMLNQPCPICDAASAHADAGEKDDADKMKAKRRVVCWVLDRSDENGADKPKLWDMGWMQDRDIAALCENRRTKEVLLVDHPDEGYDLSFNRIGEGPRTRYSGFQFDRESSAISSDPKVYDAILQFITDNPLPDTVKFMDEEALQGIVDGTHQREEEEDGEGAADDTGVEGDETDGEYVEEAGEAEAGEGEYEEPVEGDDAGGEAEAVEGEYEEPGEGEGDGEYEEPVEEEEPPPPPPRRAPPPRTVAAPAPRVAPRQAAPAPQTRPAPRPAPRAAAPAAAPSRQAPPARVPSKPQAAPPKAAAPAPRPGAPKPGTRPAAPPPKAPPPRPAGGAPAKRFR